MREGWREVAVEDVAQVIGGGTPKSKVDSYWGGDIPWLTPKDLADRPSRYTASGARSITAEGLKNSAAKLLPAGAVLLSSRAPVGYVTVASEPLATNQGFKSLVLDNSQSPDYWYYLLGHSTEYLRANSGGSTFQELSAAALKKLRFLVPPLDEQRRIVDLIGALDDSLGAIVHEDLATERLMNQLALAAVVDDTPTIPIGELAQAQFGNAFSSKDFVDNGVRLLRGDNISPQGLRWENARHLPELMVDDRTRTYLLKGGDLVLGMDRPVISSGVRVAVVEESDLPALLVQRVARLRFSDPATARRIAAFWSTSHFATRLTGTQTGSHVPHLSAGQVKGFEIPDSIIEGDAGALLVGLSEYRRQSDRAADRLRSLRRSLLAALLSGEHEIPSSYDAVAEELAA